VFQYPECQLFETTVEKDVAFGLKHSGLSTAEKQARVRWALETVGFSFEKVHDQPPMGLSGGEKRRVAIAGVLAAKPEYLILDEPIAGLDPLGREAFLQLITELNRGGMTILMVSHNADCLGAYARRLLVLEDGQLVRDGTPEEIYADLDWMRAHRLGVPQSRTAAALLKQGGLDIPQDIASYDALLAAVLCAKGGGRP
jgi:energy-coupling factor transport system ATP-binding protein